MVGYVFTLDVLGYVRKVNNATLDHIALLKAVQSGSTPISEAEYLEQILCDLAFPFFACFY